MSELKIDEKISEIYSNKHLLILKDSVFEKMSKRAWTDVLLQIYKVNCIYIYQLNSEELMAKTLFLKRSVVYSSFFFSLFLSNREEKT